MNELKEGMYVRTENGIIEKINRIYDRHATDNIVVWLNGYGDGRSVFVDDFEEVKYQSINARGFIKKEPSFDIIDLIEVGDYVNGYKISGVYDDDGVVNEYNLKHKKCLGKNIYDEDYQEYLIYEEEIETIVTKEQFESMSYKVGD